MAQMTKKKGMLALKKDNYLKVAYAHRNAQPDGVGKKIVKMCQTLGIEGLNDLYDRIILVDEDSPMTKEQVDAYKAYMPEKLWKEDLTWTEALVYTKDITKPLLDGFPYVVDYSGFCGSWRNRYRYLIDLDNNTFSVVRAGLEMISQKDDEYFADAEYTSKVAHTRVGTFPLDAIPEDWAEQCLKYWQSLMLVAVEFTENEEAMFSEEVQEEAKSDRDYERIKFFYGDQGYNDLFKTMKK